MPDADWTRPRLRLLRLGPKNSSPSKQQRALIERIKAYGAATFGDRLSADAKFFPAGAEPDATTSAHSPTRLLGYGFVGWALCAAVMAVLLRTVSTDAAIATHAIIAPLIFTGLARSYFRAPAARD